MKHNPFYDRRPVSHRENFVGRVDLLQQIFSSFVDVPVPQCLSLTGERGIGKSSLLNMILVDAARAAEHRGSGPLVVRLDIADRLTVSSDLFRLLHSRVDREIQRRHDLAATTKTESRSLLEQNRQEQDHYILRESLAEYFRWLKCQNLNTIILFDDFDRIARDVRLPEEEFEFLRALGDSTLEYSVGYLVASVIPLKEICTAAVTSGFYNIFASHAMTPLSHDDTLAFIHGPFLRSNCRLTPEEAETLVAISGGYPAILRAACELAHDELLAQPPRRLVHSELVRKVCVECSTLFDGFWARRGPEEKDLLLGLARGADVPFSSTFQRCEDLALVRRDSDGYRFVSEAFGAYVRATDSAPLVRPTMSPPTQPTMPVPESVDSLLRNAMFGLGAGLARGIGAHLQDAIDEVPQKTAHLVLSTLSATLNQEFSSLRASILAEDSPESVQTYAEFVRARISSVLAGSNELGSASLKGAEVSRAWELLRPETREFVSLGELLYEIFQDSDMDLAHVSICYCRALELEASSMMISVLSVLAPNHEVTRGGRRRPVRELSSLMLGEVHYLLVNLPALQAAGSRADERGFGFSRFCGMLKDARDLRNNAAHPNEPVTRGNLEVLRLLSLGSVEQPALLEQVVSFGQLVAESGRCEMDR